MNYLFKTDFYFVFQTNWNNLGNQQILSDFFDFFNSSDYFQIWVKNLMFLVIIWGFIILSFSHSIGIYSFISLGLLNVYIYSFIVKQLLILFSFFFNQYFTI